MKRIENTEKIKSINFTRTVHPYCPLGGDYYSAEIDVNFTPDKYYPDYCEVDEEIQKFGGEPLTIEQLAEKVYDIMAYFNPVGLEVSIYAESNKHFPVTVTKASPY